MTNVVMHVKAHRLQESMYVTLATRRVCDFVVESSVLPMMGRFEDWTISRSVPDLVMMAVVV